MIRPTAQTLAMLCALALPAFAKVAPDEFTAACGVGENENREASLPSLE